MPESRNDARGAEAPQSRSKIDVRRRRERGMQAHDLHRFLADFRSGLGKLKTITQRLIEQRSGSSPSALPPQRTEHVLRQELLQTLERELRLVESAAPPEIRDRVVKEFRTKAESAIAMGLPQSYARLVGAAQEQFRGTVPPPAKALRPNQSPAVRALLSAVTAIRNGRLAFLPRETRVETRKLLQRIFSSGRAERTPSAPQIAKLVQSQRLLPNIVQGMMRSYEKPEQYGTYIDAVEHAKEQYFLPEPPGPEGRSTIPHVVPQAPESAPQPSDNPSPPRKQPTPLTAADIPRLSKAVPSFQTTGAAHAYMYEPGEDVHVVTRNDGLMTEATPPSLAGAPQGAGGEANTPPPRRSGARTISAPAPAARSTSAAPTGSAATARDDTSKPVSVTGALRIDGLPQFIANTEMRLSGLESRARRQDG
jgi:hypothetical protein